MSGVLSLIFALGVIVLGLCALAVLLPCLALIAFMIWLFSPEGQQTSRPGEGLFDGR